MPRRDGTGPSGQGPRTGKGLGNCGPKKNMNPQTRSDNMGQGLTRGIRRINNGSGRGQGRGQGSGKGNK